ncbi:MAG: glycosyltransferase family 4 protein, partial [Deltaproteobacteria bacterium]|nr:glycosyltransferase family 4 protein [Deltaproteobacteria bacterium]
APGRIHFGGYHAGDALLDAYRALDVAVWLREGNDGSCRGVLEAMACGVPVIAGHEGAPAELVDSQSGRVVDSTSPSAIAAALRELLGDPALRKSLGAAARTRAASFTTERSCEATLAFYRELAALPPIERDRP